ncbi:MAG: class I SAM-dependent methyltransferase [Candidatus Micrarchaeia archaeon]
MKKYEWVDLYRSVKAPEAFYKAYQKKLDIIDERHLVDFINSYHPNSEKIVVDLGIGPGRELEWLDKIKNIHTIIGVDFSKYMLDFCKNVAKRYLKRVVLIHEDFRDLSRTKRFIKNRVHPIIFICLVNTLGNFPPRDRLRVLRKVRMLMNDEDRIVLMLYKLPQDMKIDSTAIKRIPIHLRPRGYDIMKYLELIDYSFQNWIWDPVVEIFGSPPIITYDEVSQDIAAYVGDKKVFASHRWSKKEIKDLHKLAGLKIDRIIEGDYAYVVVSKK